MSTTHSVFTLRATSGFTLIELLLVIGIIATLAAIVILAINPTLQLTKAEDAKRTSNAREIKSAINQYIIDNGYPPAGLSATEQPICSYNATDTSGCLDLDVLVDEDYLVTLEQDVKETSANNLGYTASQSTNGFLNVEPTYIGQSGGSGGSGGGGPVPQISTVYVNSSAWTSDYRDYVHGLALDDGLNSGYPIPTDSTQLDTLPWVNINQILLEVSEDISGSLETADITLNVTPGIFGDASPANAVQVSTVSWDSDNDYIVIDLDSNIEPSTIEIFITASDLSSAGGTTLASDYLFTFKVLPADVEDASFELVTQNDRQYIEDRVFGGIYDGFGIFNFDDPKADLNGSQVIDSFDTQFTNTYSGATLQ